ncbi:RluA family pseudouridine synthase [Halobacillus campisalis]|uniref:Pseudouridine synthase n=2 Tax=Halobacillus campisalis TaxID=435909 RepID=A0ABW2K3H9_9BACI|nr:RluA family pseudouridine synthase [Halobacillus campisalis]
MIPLYPMSTLTKVFRVHKEGVLREFMRSDLKFSRQLLKKVKTAGKLFVNGGKADLNYPVKRGDLLKVVFPKEERGLRMTGEQVPLSIIYEDEDILVLNKPPGIAVSPGRDHSSGTLAQGILYYYDEHDIPFTVHIVTRLDRDTSGLILVAKHSYSHSVLTAQGIMVDRKYTALVEGRNLENEGTIDKPIRRNSSSIIQREVHEEGKKAITEFRVLDKASSSSKIQCKILTGRTHQIRVHMASLNSPILGDSLYGSAFKGLKGQALHCHELAVVHPWTGKCMKFTCSHPKEWDYI